MNKLTKKTYKNYEKLSRYSPFPIYYNNEDKKYIGGVTSWLSSDSPFSEYQVKKGDSLDLLSLMFYSSSAYYWVIADYNKINDPYQDLEEGQILKIPVLSNIKFKDFE